MSSTGCDVAAVTDSVAALVDGLSTDSWRLSDSEIRESLGRVAQAQNVLAAAFLSLVRELDSRLPGSTTEAVVREVTGASAGAARRAVAAARVSGPGAVLGGFGERLAAGDVSREHVDVAVRVLDAVPVSVRQRDGAEAVITRFLMDAVDAGAGPRALKAAGVQVLARLDPDGDCRGFDPDADQRRFLHMHTDATGMLVGRFQLDPVAGATVRAALHAHSAPDPEVVAEDGSMHRDERSTAQRYADALVTVADAVLGISTVTRGERPRVVVHATPAQLAHVARAGRARIEGGDPVPAPVLDRLSCDAVLHRLTEDPTMGPLDVGRRHRLVTLAQRRALEARDDGCIVCGAHPRWCDAHHLIPWAAGGASDVSNLALLCPRHHSAVHTGAWRVERRPQGILLIPPKSVDPRQVPRPPFSHALTQLIHDLQPEVGDAADSALSG